MSAPANPQIAVILGVIEVLDALAVPHHLGGSYASSIHGVPRYTHDVDIVVALTPAKVALLAARFEAEFYVDADAIRSAIVRQSSFNLIHRRSGLKIDCFVQGQRPFDRLESARARRESLGEEGEAFVKSPEDTVLRKLEWFRAGGETSDRQWNDILGLLRVQGTRLDDAYLDKWAADLEISDLLYRARTASRT